MKVFLAKGLIYLYMVSRFSFCFTGNHFQESVENRFIEFTEQEVKVLNASEQPLVLIGQRVQDFFLMLQSTGLVQCSNELQSCYAAIQENRRLLLYSDFCQALSNLAIFAEHLKIDTVSDLIPKEAKEIIDSIYKFVVVRDSNAFEKVIYVCSDVLEQKDEIDIASGTRFGLAYPPRHYTIQGNLSVTDGLHVGGGGVHVDGPVSFGDLLLINEINPRGPDGGIDDAGITVFSGNVGVEHGKKLLVNEIDPVTVNGDENALGTITFSGHVLFSQGFSVPSTGVDGDVSIAQDLSVEGTVQATFLRVFNDVDIGGTVQATVLRVFDDVDVGGTVQATVLRVFDDVDVGGTVQATVLKVVDDVFANRMLISGDTVIKPPNKLLVNEIDPVKSEGGSWVPDEDGTTVFSGDVVIADEKSLSVGRNISVDHNVIIGNRLRIKYDNVWSCDAWCQELGPLNTKVLNFDKGIAIQGVIVPYPSDDRVKFNKMVIDPQESLERVLTLQPKSFEYGYESQGNIVIPQQKRQRGFIAQEVMHTFPEAINVLSNYEVGDVTYDELYHIDYNKFTADIVGAIQAINQKTEEITELKNEIKMLKQQVAALTFDFF